MKKSKLKSQSAITLVAVVVTVIVLLILSAIAFMLVNDLVMDKAVTASIKTTEAILQEKVEMAWIDTKMHFLEERHNFNEIMVTESFKTKLAETLKESYYLENVIIVEEEENISLTVIYENQTFNFTISTKNDEISIKNLLKGKVKIGDYVEYPIEYKDAWSKEDFTSSNGWRVLDDGVMEGTSGHVKIISTGVPVKWFYESTNYPNNQVIADKLINDFENMVFENAQTGKSVNGSEFKDEKMASRLTTLTLSELNRVYNLIYEENRSLDDVSPFENDTYKLFNLKGTRPSYYWLATPKKDSDNELYYVLNNTFQYDFMVRVGIRPVIELKEGLSGKLENNVWKVMD